MLLLIFISSVLVLTQAGSPISLRGRYIPAAVQKTARFTPERTAQRSVVSPIVPVFLYQPAYEQGIPWSSSKIEKVENKNLNNQNKLESREYLKQLDETSYTEPSILTYSNDMGTDGAYSYGFETADGISREETSEMSENGFRIVRGFYSYPSPDGRIIMVRYTADQNGFRTSQNDDDTIKKSFRSPRSRKTYRNI